MSVKVLVADDDLIVVKLLAAQLRHLGYEPQVVHEGEAALAALLAEAGPRLALLDGDMPGLSGLEVCRRARATARPLHLVLVSARRDADDVAAALAAGADDFLCKPVELEDLRLRLRLGERLVGLAGGAER